MLLTLEIESDIPLYLQIRDQVVEAIAGGHLPEGSRLPSAQQLAADFGINIHTVTKAFDLLQHQGFVHVSRKRGTIVHLDPSVGDRFEKEWERSLRTQLAEACARKRPPQEVLQLCQQILSCFSSPQEDWST